MQGQWFYGIATNKVGPMPALQLQQLARTGQIGPQTLVWSEGMPQWVPAGSMPLTTMSPASLTAAAVLKLLSPTPPAGCPRSTM